MYIVLNVGFSSIEVLEGTEAYGHILLAPPKGF